MVRAGPAYAELHAVSAFSFRRGASLPQELMAQAGLLGYRALALTDDCSMAGVVRAYEQQRRLREENLHVPELLIGSELNFADGLRCVAIAGTPRGYSNLCRIITQARRTGDKGAYHLVRDDVGSSLEDCSLLWVPRGEPAIDELTWLRERYAGRLWIAVELHRDGGDADRLARLRALSTRFGVPLVAAGDVHMHVAQRRALQDVMAALRHRRPVVRCGHRLFPNAERHLRTLADLASLYPRELLDETLCVAERCVFRIETVRYQYPKEIVEPTRSPNEYLRILVERHIPERWPAGCSGIIRGTIERELRLIAAKKHEPFFLTVYDIVRHARSRKILCQGRGSAANSIVCYVLGITEVDPEKNELLFERFMSAERDEEPDIDVDFEHERREEVIQYVFDKYGRERAAIAATVIGYGMRSALRDVGRALDIGEEIVDRVAKSLAWWDRPEQMHERLRRVGVDPQAPRIALWIRLAGILAADAGFPRHLSQHVGGFVISDGPLHELVPVENAVMPGRTVIQWDKDDLETLGLLKVDVLALGMLSALRRMLALLGEFGEDLDYRDIRDRGYDDDPQTRQTYDMICRAETIGVFQIESRAQMTMLPRLRPKTQYDLTVQVAIVRPGPIQGGMVHPYLKQRNMDPEKIPYPLGNRDPIKQVLKRTSGVPIFQEQVMQIAMVAAGFSASRADALRRAMAAWKRNGHVDRFRDELMAGMDARGYGKAYAEGIFRQIEGFGSYGFPESHAASFALLAYKSAWLKRHRPAAFTCGLINAQPMGFYPVSMLVAEARRMGVEVRPADVRASRWDCHLERDARGQMAVRLGLRLVRGFNEAAALRIVAARIDAPFGDLDDLARRAALSARELDLLADADALQTLAGHRFQARWQARGYARFDGVLTGVRLPDEAAALRAPTEGEAVLADYRTTHLSLRRHPVSLLRGRLERLGIAPNRELGTGQWNDGDAVRVAGMVMFRQRPGSANGAMFLTLEDDTGVVNLIVRPQLIDAERDAVVGGRFLLAKGRLQKQGSEKVGWVIHVLADRFADRSHWIAGLPYLSRDFH
ncbi:MAG: error-prone DNA polymerase [Solimonas sp.]